MPDKKIPLSRPITGHGETFNEIILREPAYPDIMLLGEPSAFARDGSGMIYTAEKDDTIRAYIERLLVSPKDSSLLNQLNATDTFQLRDAVHDFFASARPKTV